MVSVSSSHIECLVTDCSYNVDESGGLQLLPQHADPYKKPKKFKDEMSHQLRFFRFNHRTHIPTGRDLSIDEFFSEHSPPQEEVPLLDDVKSRPQRHQPQDDKETSPAADASSLAGEEQVLIENTKLSDEYILNKIVAQAKR